MSKLALERIAKEKKEKTGKLNLGSCGLRDFPKELFELTWLVELNTAETDLLPAFLRRNINIFYNACLPKEFSKLENLKILKIVGDYFQRSKIIDISVISELKKLEGLDFSWNEISDISPIQELRNLTNINFFGNKICKISPIQELTNLISIDFLGNEIINIDPIKELKNLTIINFFGNKIIDITPIQKLKNLTNIYFDNNQISDIAPIQYLEHLSIIAFNHNNIMDLSPLQDLKNLTNIDFDRNQIRDIAPIQDLKNLTNINFDSNQIRDIAPIQDLKNLTNIYFDSNQIRDISPIKDLKNLTNIYFGSNQIRDISPIKDLKNVRKIGFSYNRISDISPIQELKTLSQIDFDINQINDITTINELKNLTRVNFLGNPINLPSNTLDDIEKLRAYFADAKKGTTEKRQIKLIFLGDGCVGKTTLLEHLKSAKKPQSIDPNNRTEGVQTEIWKEYFPNYTINIWDFGGQDVLHSTHRLFLGERALYVLAWCKQSQKRCTQDETHPLTYWLDFIADYGSNSIVLLVENIIDGGFSNEFPDVLKLEELVNYYKSKKINLITTHHRFDFLNDTDEVESFKDVIKNNIKKLQKLYPIDGYPKNWYNLQQKLSDLRINNKTITYQQYIEIAKDKEFDISNPDAFLNHFIDNGLVGYYPELSNQIILQMDWVLDAMYACLKLKNNPLLRTKGKLNKDDFDLVWQNYNAKEKKLFLNYMQASHLLYKVNGSIHREYQYLLPALFAEKSKRDKIEWHEKPTYIVIKFGFVFGSIMQQLQVRILNHCHIEEEETFFKNYISFTDKNNQDAYIEMIIEEKELRILCGNERLRQTLLTELNEIYPLDRVAIFSKSGEKEISYQFDRKEKKLFSDIELENSKIKEEMTTIKEVKTFVTYSWTDKDGKFDEVHQKRVGRFVNQLIEKWSIDATFDLFESESNFIKMMYDNLFKNDKIIIVLSEGYAIKANNFKLSGVETEYTAIINDIKKNPTKYILVAFDSREGDIYPFGFQGNDTILINGDLLDNVLNNREQERLLSKLIDEPVYEKPKKGNNRPSIIKKKF